MFVQSIRGSLSPERVCITNLRCTHGGSHRSSCVADDAGLRRPHGSYAPRREPWKTRHGTIRVPGETEVPHSHKKKREGAVGGQDVFIVLLSFFDAIGVCGDDFHVVLATLLRMTDSDISAT